jgi:RHS repeat-associated protein
VTFVRNLLLNPEQRSKIRENYYPFGLPISRDGSLPEKLRNGINRKSFVGKESQVATGYIDLSKRFYDPAIGRFIQVDPLGESMNSWPPFNYTFNNPLKFVDKDGTVPDITIHGTNNSSVTVKTDRVNLEINASSLGIDFGGNYSFSGKEVLQAAVDIGGVVDPTPTLDIIGAGLSAESGDYWGAGARMQYSLTINYYDENHSDDPNTFDIQLQVNNYVQTVF